MKFKVPVLILLLIIGYSSSAYACTSFALYGPQIFYGMNFDYFSIPLKFLIESNRGGWNFSVRLEVAWGLEFQKWGHTLVFILEISTSNMHRISPVMLKAARRQASELNIILLTELF